jgi:hypothetical protein
MRVHTHSATQPPEVTCAHPDHKPKPPYPEFCRHPEKCAGKGACPREITCAD